MTGIDAELAVGGAIEGTVTRAPGGEPVEEVEVCAWDDEAELWGGCTFPDSEGKYALRGLLAGEYTVEFWPYESDLLPQYYDGKSKASEADPVPVALGETRSGIDAELQLGGTIEGTVKAASNGAPVQWVEACAWEVPDEYWVRCDFSAADGTYAIQGLRDGDYKVEFWAGETGMNLLDQYWDHKANWSEANVLSVTAGGVQTGINADLLARPVPPVTPPTVTPPTVKPPVTTPRKRKCRRGFKKKRVKGKVRCVKARKKRRHQRQGAKSKRELQPPFRAAYWRHCGDQKQMGAGWFNVRAHNIGCRKARGVAHAYVWGGDDSPAGFSCQQFDVGYELSRVACLRILNGRLVQKVRFQFGA